MLKQTFPLVSFFSSIVIGNILLIYYKRACCWGRPNSTLKLQQGELPSRCALKQSLRTSGNRNLIGFFWHFYPNICSRASRNASSLACVVLGTPEKFWHVQTGVTCYHHTWRERKRRHVKWDWLKAAARVKDRGWQEFIEKNLLKENKNNSISLKQEKSPKSF